MLNGNDTKKQENMQLRYSLRREARPKGADRAFAGQEEEVSATNA